MKKIYLSAFTILLAGFSAKCQDYKWAARAGSWAYDYGYGVGTDASGNVYVAGKYEMDAMFGSTQVTCEGNHDIYLAKYSSAGQIQWVKTAGGADGDYARSLAVDASGNCYIAGEIEGQTSFSGTTVAGKAGDNDGFVAKYDANGNLKWAIPIGGWSNDKAVSISIDDAGNSYVTGIFKTTADFGSHQLTSQGGEDIFVIKIDNNGNVKWARSAGGNQDDEGKSIKTDGSGNVYVTGYISGSTMFGSTPVNASSGYFDIFLAKYNSSGDLLWAKNAGSAWDDVGWGVAVDPSGNAIITGEFNADASFGNKTIYSGGNSDIFIASYSPAGDVNWVKSYGGTGIDRARGIAVDESSNIFLTGQFSNSAGFGAHQVTGIDTMEVFIAGFNSDGTGKWALKAGGDADAFEDLGYEAGIAISAKGNEVLATGSILSGGAFGDHFLSSYDRTDMFLVKIDQTMPLNTNSHKLEQMLATVYPNPSAEKINVTLPFEKNLITIFNTLGEEVSKITGQKGHLSHDITSLPDGMYYIHIVGDNQNMTTRFIKK